MPRELQQRIIDISKKLKLSHLGSCLTAVPIIDNIYNKMTSDDIFILSSGHAGLALYVVLEKYFGLDAYSLFKKHGVHPNRCLEDKIYLSTGSLGMGITVAVGAALASPHKKIYCLLSDGECAEGSVWESLAFAYNKQITNLEIYVNANGFSAYDKVNLNYLKSRLQVFFPKINFINTSILDSSLPLNGTLDDHYKVL